MLRVLVIRLAILVGVVCALLLAATAKADVWQLEELSLDYAKYKSDTRDAMLYPIVPTDRLDLRVNTTILQYGFFDSLVHSETAQTQFREVGWQYRVGVRVGRLELYGEHYSQHFLDMQGPTGYPVQNLLGVKFNIFKREK